MLLVVRGFYQEDGKRLNLKVDKKGKFGTLIFLICAWSLELFGLVQSILESGTNVQHAKPGEAIVTYDFNTNALFLTSKVA